jgi:hypothetical protein
MHSNKYAQICQFSHRLALSAEMASFMAIEKMPSNVFIAFIRIRLVKVLKIGVHSSVLVDARCHRAPFLINVK